MDNDLLYTVTDGVATIQMNREKGKNSMTTKQFNEIGASLKKADADDEVKVVILTGVGEFYSSGADLMEATSGGDMTLDPAFNFIASFIDFSKPIIAAVNGLCIGVAVTTLGLCDFVVASENATFTTPFMKLSFCAEGCSSVTFPRIMGERKAKEMLLLGRTFSAKDAAECGLVNTVTSRDQIMATANSIAREMSSYTIGTLRGTKDLMMDRGHLHVVNQKEFDCLRLRIDSGDVAQSVMKLFQEMQERKNARMSKL